MCKKQLFGWRLFSVLAVGGLVCSASGCGSDGSKLNPVSGKVTVDGKPLTKGDVTLKPNADKGNTYTEEVRGKIDAEGNYKIFMRATKPGEQREGAPLGWYKVAVSAMTKDPNDPYNFPNLIAERYINYSTSGLELEVVENPAAGAYDLVVSEK
jgi:hypothetical protein